MARVIINASPIDIHVAPMRAIAADLVGRGHQVTLLTGTRFRDSVAGTGAAFAGLAGTADFDPAEVSARPERMAAEAGLPRVEYDMRAMFIGPMAEQHQALQRLLAEAGDEPVAVLSEPAFWGVAPLALGAPGLRPAAFVGIGVTPFSLSSIDTGPFGAGLPPDSSEEGRARNRAANTAVQERALGGVQTAFAAMLAGLGATGAAPFVLDATALLSDRFLQLSVEELSYRRSDTPDHVRFVGALPAETPDGSQLPQWWSEVLAAPRLAVVTQDGPGSGQEAGLVEAALEALADLPLLVVAAVGDGRLPRTVPANARIARSVPLAALLPHAGVLITDGAFGTVQQSLSHGVPLILAGEADDRLEGNVRTAATGAAINLATGLPAAADIRKAVETVLAAPGHQQEARRLRSEYGRLDALAAIARTVEEFTAG